ncbi:MAG: Zn-dependent alcohol dehydrogenase [Candidatus Poribacteria bacterium]|nr:Zn-dependent alcohol dehydrogenase [Candidatus Poribacteria bacterium]
MKTRAAVLYDAPRPMASAMVVEELELDPPGVGEVVVKLAASGVCHSDYSVINGNIPHPLPVVLGHEGAGTVVEVGAGVRSVKSGDTAILTYVTPCGRCYFCTTGKPALCTTHSRDTPPGTLLDGTCRLHKRDTRYRQLTRLGTMSEYAVVSENAVVPIRPDTPLDKAALIGCAVTTGVGAVLNTAKVEAGSRIVVIGAGGVGLNVVQGARLVGASRIIVVDVVPSKLEYARKFGATDLVNAKECDPIQAVMDLTDGIGADYAFEAIGGARTIEQAFRMIRIAGTAVVIGIAEHDAEVRLPATMFPRGERRLIGCYYGSSRMRVDMVKYLGLYRDGQLNLDALVTKTYTLDQVNEAFVDMQEGRNARGVIVFD